MRKIIIDQVNKIKLAEFCTYKMWQEATIGEAINKLELMQDYDFQYFTSEAKLHVEYEWIDKDNISSKLTIWQNEYDNFMKQTTRKEEDKQILIDRLTLLIEVKKQIVEQYIARYEKPISNIVKNCEAKLERLKTTHL